MKKTVSFFFLPLLIVAMAVPSSPAGEKGLYDLRWKFKESCIAYRVSYHVLSPDAKISFFSEDFNFPTKFSMVVLLKKNKDKTISVLFIQEGLPETSKAAKPEDTKTKEKKKEEDLLIELLRATQNSVQVRGLLNEDGSIASFWTKPRQKNLLAILFELPRRRVKTGDTWKLDVSLLSYDQNFIAASYGRTNTVKLEKVKKTGSGETALLNYNISESVKGTFASKKVSMFMAFSGKGKFSLNKGCWEELSLISDMRSKGLMESEIRQLIRVQRLKSVPARYRKLR